MTQIIAFTGLKHTGKTTAADYLVSKYGFVKHGFKDALVEEVGERFPDLLPVLACLYFPNLSVHDITDYHIDWLFQNKPAPMRALLMNYGTEVRRKDDPDYWVSKWKGELQYLVDMGGVERFVVDDCRFLSEAKAIRAARYTEAAIIRLTRPDLTTPDNHSSETEQLQIEVDYTIETEQGDLEGLYRELDRVVTKLSP